jgi:hypothetical protein
VLGAISTLARELVSVATDAYPNSASVCRLLHQLAALALAVPITVMSDVARVQRCRLAFPLATSLQRAKGSAKARTRSRDIYKNASY